jgi:hypothetical protein
MPWAVPDGKRTSTYNLARRRTAHCIRNTHAIHSYLIYSAVDGQEIHEIGSERVFRAESDLLALALNELDDLERGILDICHIFAVTVFAKVARSADNDIQAVDACLDGNLGILHVASNMSEDFGLEAELADGFAVAARLLRSGGARQLNVFKQRSAVV